jgi:hypothetical protein
VGDKRCKKCGRKIRDDFVLCYGCEFKRSSLKTKLLAGGWSEADAEEKAENEYPHDSG